MHVDLSPRVRRFARELFGAGLDLVLPAVCCGCGGPGPPICETCRRQLQRRPELGCERCGEPVALSGGCLESHEPLRNLRQLVAPLRFAGVGGQLVRRFKLGGDAGAGRLLAREMADAWRAGGVASRPILVPVPLHRARLRRRGFDQARWLARRLSERLQLRSAPRVLVRIRPTRPQGDVLVRSRTENVRGAFALRSSAWLRGRDVLLVDDVFTTGATARSCARLLRRAGVRSVSLLAACRS